MSQPYISLVVATRNDSHSGNMMERLQSFVNAWVEQVETNKLESEIIIVEWNPPKNHPTINNLLKNPSSSYCYVRIITIPPETHNKIANSDKIEFFQMMAKNSGILQAKGEFVLVTNVDILFSNEIVSYFASKTLSLKKIYRVDRYDIQSAGFPFNGSIVDKLNYANDNILRVNRRTITQNLVKSESLIDKGKRIASVSYHLIKFGTFLHTNACGDFMLMSSNNWGILRGYPEYPIYSIYLDGLTCYAAHYSGIKETMLKYKIFHIDHSESWAVNDKLKRDIPQLSYRQYLNLIQKMRRGIMPNL